MITDAISPATFAPTEVSHSTKPQLKAEPSDYAMALYANVPNNCDTATRWTSALTISASRKVRIGRNVNETSS